MTKVWRTYLGIGDAKLNAMVDGQIEKMLARKTWNDTESRDERDDEKDGE